MVADLIGRPVEVTLVLGGVGPAAVRHARRADAELIARETLRVGYRFFSSGFAVAELPDAIRRSLVLADAPALSTLVRPSRPPNGWYDELKDAVEHGGEPVQHDVSEHEFSERIVCGDCATDEERTAQALGGASIERTMRELAREEGVLPREEEEGPRDPDDEDADEGDDDPVPA